MTVIGLDLGTSCGWAVLADGVRVASGTWDLASRRHEGGGMRFVRARSLLGELLAAWPGAIVGYEEVARHAGTSAAHVYGGLLAVVTGLCEERSVPYSGIPVGTIKRRATGRGNADKLAMVAAANATFGVVVESDDEADALWCAVCLSESVSGGV